MTSELISYERWQPLSLAEVTTIFADAPFAWCMAGGYAVEQFLGMSIRAHSDIDVLVFRDEQLAAQAWLDDFLLYAADPPGTLRKWNEGEYLPVGIHDIWGHRSNADAWQLQLMLMEVDGDEWVSRRDPKIRGLRSDLITDYNGVPCIRIEVQLLYKVKGRRQKDELDLKACVPLMSAEAKQWLRESITLLYPEGHDWTDVL